ncbi:MAG TPA: hypothetical protein VMW16_15235 [Sedimentisphaerales bacterium]|nr:hypothetical protein [Sedimentisphaerales bacterium]
MFSFFEQPWTLLIAALISWRVLDAVLSETSTRWQWLLLTLLIAASYVFERLLEAGMLKLSTPMAVAARGVLLAGIVALLALPLVQAYLSRERYWQLWLLPPCLALAAFGCDWLVKTDIEKINALIKTGIKAVEEENCDVIAAVIAPDYADSYHNTKETLLAHCRRRLSGPVIEKSKTTALEIEISPSDATATLTVLTTFDKEGYVCREYFMPSLLTRICLRLRKQPDKKWLIGEAEILELNHIPAGWKDIR